MTIQEIKDQVAREHGYESWFHAIRRPVYHLHFVFEEVARRFAKAMIEEDRKDAAEKARGFLGVTENEETEVYVDKSSITDRPLPDLK